MSLRDQPDQFKVGSSLPFNARLPFRWCLSLSLLSLALAGFGLTWLQPMIPLLYSVTNTSLQLVSRWWILVFPGLGTIIGGRTTEGIYQIVLFIAGIALSFILVGIPIVIGVWIWALVSGIQLIKEAEA